MGREGDDAGNGPKAGTRRGDTTEAQDGEWEEALMQAEQWLDDQPFDTKAAVLASYVAAVGLERWRESAEAARLGLRASPGNPLLTNNLAYALIEDGQLDEATKAVADVELSDVSSSDQVALTATRGLLKFRRGEPMAGEALYQQAIDTAHRLNDRSQEAMARAMLLREKLLHHDSTRASLHSSFRLGN